MPLDPQVEALLAGMATSGAPVLNTLPPVAAREVMIALGTLGGEPEQIHKTEDREIPGPMGTIPIRIYTPKGEGPFPVLVYFHGGGWVIGGIETHDVLCRALANASGCVIVSVEYRLAPEHKFPAGAEDCYAATKWVAEHAAEFNALPEQVAVGGDSAGGNLSAVVTLMARERGGPALRYQLLIYPATDYKPDTLSYKENSEGYFLIHDDIVWFWSHYVSSENEARHPHASPLRAESLHDLPSAMIITAEFDPLRDEGELYANRLKEAGVPVEYVCYPGVIHGFLSMAGAIDQGKQALANAGAALHSALYKE